TFTRDPSLLQSPKALADAIAAIARSQKLHRRTIKRWVYEWLRSGRNPAAVVRKFLKRDSDQAVRPQAIGKKRGVRGRIPEFASEAPSHEVMPNIKEAWDLQVLKQKKKWTDAYHDMLIEKYGVPEEAF